MILYDFTDTICAISTPSGIGGIAVIRISGKQAFSIADQVFISKNKTLLSESNTHTLIFGEIVKEGELLDEVVASVYKGKKSYMGEDTIEFSCHGSLYIQQELLQLLISKGARLAMPGEFTQRAFMSGRFDLSQAEAVGDLISAQTEMAHKLSLHQMRGGFSEEIKQLRQQLLHFASLIELELDFSQEDVEFVDRTELLNLLLKIQDTITGLSNSFAQGNVIKHGIPIAIIGEPNVGKSTLLNAMLNEERAIVSNIPGTTRDSIEDTFTIEGVLYRFIDTAGIRETNDLIETIGIQRTFQTIEKASIVLYLFDIQNTSFVESQQQLLAMQSKTNDATKIFLTVFNKVDKTPNSETSHENILYISAKEKRGLEALKKTITKAAQIQFTHQKPIVVTNVRHYEALTKTNQFVSEVILGLKNNIPTDLLTVDIRSALHHLGSITGEITTDEILGNIFGKFCIGK